MAHIPRLVPNKHLVTDPTTTMRPRLVLCSTMQKMVNAKPQPNCVTIYAKRLYIIETGHTRCGLQVVQIVYVVESSL